MKAKELMIGDWVYVSKNFTQKHHKIRALSNDEGAVLRGIYVNEYGVESNSVFSPNDTEPIPLTPKILEKNGFEYFHKNYSSLSYDHPFKLKMTNWPDENGLGGLWSITDLIKIRYVHELQHALRLCGIKKEIIL